MNYYKFLSADGRSPKADNHMLWSLPTKNDDGTWTPGEWMPIVTTLEKCVSGYHYTDAAHLLMYANSRLFAIEIGPGADSEWYGDKGTCSQCRLLYEIETWNQRTWRELACDFAEHVLYLYEAYDPDDSRVRACIEVTRRYIRGEATREELSVAASDASTADAAAWAASFADAAAWAAWAVAAAARAATATSTAAWAASSADAAAWAAWAVTRDTEHVWQVQHMCETLDIEYEEEME